MLELKSEGSRQDELARHQTPVPQQRRMDMKTIMQLRNNTCSTVGSIKVALVLLGCALAMNLDSAVQAQEPAIEAVQAAGGRVSQISAAGPEMEVNFGLVTGDVKDDVLPEVAKIENVIWLNLRSSEITDEGLAAISRMSGLTRLHLEKTAIGDAGMKHLAKLENLEYLNLYATKVGDEGIAQLAPLKNLRKLYVWQSAVTEEGMQKLAAALPELEIVGELKLEEPKVIESSAETATEGEGNSEEKAAAGESEKKEQQQDKKESEKGAEAKKGGDKKDDER